MYHHNVMRHEIGEVQVIGLDPVPGLNLFDDIDLDLGQDLQFENTKLQELENVLQLSIKFIAYVCLFVVMT